MKGIELSKAFYEEYGKPMLENDFSDILKYLAVGIFGSGSECFGFDDEVSTDHDFEPGFCIFLPDEDIIDRKTAFALERAYAKLPKEFEGFRRSLMSPVGGARRGVLRTGEFFEEKIGNKTGELDKIQWLSVPEQSLAEATNGELFFDNYGEVSKIREALKKYPEDIRLKKLAGNLLLMAQSGQYNYKRCIDHGESAAAQLAVFEFVKSAMQVIFLLNNAYQPYYKWSFRALRALPKLSLDAEIMEFLLTSSNDGEMAEEKYYSIEGIAADVIDELVEQNLTNAICGDLEKHAYSVNDKIADSEIRNMHILAAI
ncbi:MAG: DUF4037 domain-containing protein [Ruminococcaceae bacterium]|nr:DUF4037 domain-containing protein [Oscillospiraceae bacterium]